MVHEMISDALQFESWNGDWMDLEEWFSNWQLYIEAGCPGITDQAKAVLLIKRLLKQNAEFLKDKLKTKRLTETEMIAWLLHEKGV